MAWRMGFLGDLTPEAHRAGSPLQAPGDRSLPIRTHTDAACMRVILGIGNPGAEYDGTRHNLGFAVVDELARRHAANGWSAKWRSQVAEWRPPSEWNVDRALLMKPQTYVNLSGEAALATLSFHKLTPPDLLVVVDDLALPLGTLRLRADGSAGGHNGLRDIEARIGKAYPRLRLGMGPMPPGADQVGFVLGRFAPDQRAVADDMIRRAADCAEAWLREGAGVACRFNRPAVVPEPPPARIPKPNADGPPAG
jgi:PTH1 family peptidyl-tRNA hydrolase